MPRQRHWAPISDNIDPSQAVSVWKDVNEEFFLREREDIALFTKAIIDNEDPIAGYSAQRCGR